MKRLDCPENGGTVSSKIFSVKPNIPNAFGFANSDVFQKRVYRFADTAVCKWAKQWY
jgi:hypothetical protein